MRRMGIWDAPAHPLGWDRDRNRLLASDKITDLGHLKVSFNF